jgi:hypothetical protein
VTLGEVHLAAGRVADAAAVAQRALSSDPKNALARALVLASTGKR